MGCDLRALTMGHIVTRKKPHSDFKAPKLPEHDFPYSWLGDPACARCGMLMSAANSSGKPCYTDAQLRDARIMGGIMKGLRHG